MKVFVQASETHDPGPGHPERPGRIAVCEAVIEELGLVSSPFTTASRADLEAAHDPEYIAALAKLAAEGGAWLDHDTYLGPHSPDAVADSAGAVCAAIEVAMEESVESFCVVRPPGHHAGRDYAKGFCLINQIAVGAMRARSHGASKVLIFDFDVHHGNGTQDIFWSDPSVLYVSIHQWPWFPGTGALDEIGDGTIVNLPLAAGAGDAAYMAAIERIVLPVARSFQPELILVSAGFDAHALDPLSLMSVTETGFGAMTAAVRSLALEVCDGKWLLVLEGGYDPEGLERSLREVLRVMDGGSASHIEPAGSAEIDRLVAFHAARWPIA